MYLFSKLLGWFLNPLAWVVVLLAMAVLWPRQWPQKMSRRLSLAAFGLLLLSGWEWPAQRLLQALEDRHPRPPIPQEPVAGVVVLGGALGPGSVAARRGQVPMNDAAERMTEAMALARRHPAWTVVFSGGDGHILSTEDRPEAWLAAQLWAQNDLPAAQLRLEDKSRNTAENAVFSARLPQLDPKAHWLLITSAWHMPRALEIFQQAGWHVTPWPVDYRSDPVLLKYSLADAPKLWQLALKEYVGRLAGPMQVKGAGT